MLERNPSSGLDNKKISNVVSTLEQALKLFEEDRINSFVNWPFDENEKCSVSEVKE